MMREEYAYWMAFAHMDSVWTKRKNEILVKCLEYNQQLSDFFMYDTDKWQSTYGITPEEVPYFLDAKANVVNYAFVVEDLLEQGYNIIPITSENYPKTLKKNLKYNSPLLLYTKGNTALLNEKSVAIVGSRNAKPVSLTFTDKVAKMAVSRGQVVVSGGAKGVDQQALVSAVGANGKSIVVLPQGITTYGTGFQTLHKAISSGRVIVISPFAPSAPWSAGFAMARNPIIYGLADEIYVAESDNKGGTYSGVVDGLRKKRDIFVRLAEENEENANYELIQIGAKAVDMLGNPADVSNYTDYKAKLRDFITGHAHSAKECALHLYNQDDRAAQGKVKRLLNQMDDVVTKQGSPMKYIIAKEMNQELTLF